DPSEAFTRMRQEAWSGTLRDAAWIEFGADPGANPNDRKQWAKANPSYPHRTPAESIERLQRKLKPESFLREGLGIWEDMARGSVFGPGKWDACKGPLPTGVELGALGLALSLNAEKASLVGAGAAGARLLVKPLQSGDRKSTRLNSSHVKISYAVFCLKKKRNDVIRVLAQDMTVL